MKQIFRKAAIASVIVLVNINVFAQNAGVQAGAQAINQATTDIKSFFEPTMYLMYVIAAITAIFGAYKVYSKMQAGDQDVQKSMVNWGLGVLFLLSIGAILQAVFFQ